MLGCFITSKFVVNTSDPYSGDHCSEEVNQFQMSQGSSVHKIICFQFFHTDVICDVIIGQSSLLNLLYSLML